MDRSQMEYEDFADLLRTRLRQVRAANPDQQKALVELARDLVQRSIPWSVVLAATRTAASEMGLEDRLIPKSSGEDAGTAGAAAVSVIAPADADPHDTAPRETTLAAGLSGDGASGDLAAPVSDPAGWKGGAAPGAPDELLERRPAALSRIDPRDLAQSPPPPLRREAGRYEREQLSASTRQAIRMGRQARRWHEIRKMRNVLMNIDQGYLKRMLGAESDALSQEINALLRAWAPLVREQSHGGRPTRRRR